MGRPDRYTYREEWSEEDGAYVARCLEFPSLAAHGPSPELALSELRGVVAVVVEDLASEGAEIPEPLGTRSYSGKLVLRLPKEVHREAAIRAAEEGVSLNQYLVAGLAIARIEREGLWRQGGYENLRAYRIDQAERLKMPSSTISNRRRIAEAWMVYRKSLGRFDMSGHVQKLVFLEEAGRRNGKKEAVQAFKTMTYREFKDFARPELAAPELEEVDVQTRDGWILIDGEAVLGLSDDLEVEEKDFVRRVLVKAYQARKGNLIPAVIPVYDEGEARALERYLKQLRASK